MKVAVVGCGAVGSFYGAKLVCAGHEVHFLLRSDYEQVSKNGLYVESPSGDFQVRPKCAKEPKEIGPVDLVLIGLKTTANHQFSHLLPALVRRDTLLLTLQNGLGNEKLLAEHFGKEQVLGALCFVCLNRIRPGVVRHLDHGDMILGEFCGPRQPRTEELAKQFEKGGVQCEVTDNLARAHWQKLCWNIPFNGLGVSAAAGYEATISGDWNPKSGMGRCLPTDELLKDAKWERLVRQLMGEVIGVARRLGFDLPESLAQAMIDRTLTMGPYKASTVLDVEVRRRIEVESIFAEPLRRAKAAGYHTPRLEALCAVLKELDAAIAAEAI